MTADFFDSRGTLLIWQVTLPHVGDAPSVYGRRRDAHLPYMAGRSRPFSSRSELLKCAALRVGDAGFGRVVQAVANGAAGGDGVAGLAAAAGDAVVGGGVQREGDGGSLAMS